MKDVTEIKLTLPKPPSLNKIYAGQHWAIRKKYKDDYKAICCEALADFDTFTCEAFRLVIRYHSRMDIDNGILVSKFLADTLVAVEAVKDDSPKYYDKVTIRFNESLPKDTYQVKLLCKNIEYHV